MRRRWSNAAGTASLAVLACLAIGCAGRSDTPPPAFGARSDVAPALVIERFLHAANARDLATMARLFGNREGSVLERVPRAEVEQWMFVLANVLRHDDYTIEREAIAPGRLGQAIRIFVLMQFGERSASVPFTVVQTEAGGWLVEAFDIEAITSME